MLDAALDPIEYAVDVPFAAADTRPEGIEDIIECQLLGTLIRAPPKTSQLVEKRPVEACILAAS